MVDLVDGATSSTHRLSVAVHELNSVIELKLKVKILLKLQCAAKPLRKCLQGKRGRRKKKKVGVKAV